MNLKNIYSLILQGEKPTIIKSTPKAYHTLGEAYKKVNEATLTINFDTDKEIFQQEIDINLANKIKNFYFSETNNLNSYIQNWLVSAKWESKEHLITDIDTKDNVSEKPKIMKLTLFFKSIIEDSLGNNLDIKRVIDDVKVITELKNKQQLNNFSDAINQKDKTKYSLKNIIKKIPGIGIFAENEEKILSNLIPVSTEQGVGPGEIFFTCFTEAEKHGKKEGDFILPKNKEVIEAKYKHGRLGEISFDLNFIKELKIDTTKKIELSKLQISDETLKKLKAKGIKQTTPESLCKSYKQYKESRGSINPYWKEFEESTDPTIADVKKLIEKLNTALSLEENNYKSIIDNYFIKGTINEGVVNDPIDRILGICVKLNYNFDPVEVINLFKKPNTPPHKILAALQLLKYIETKKFNYFFVFNTNEYMVLNCNDIKLKIESEDTDTKYQAFTDVLNFILLPEINITPAFDRGGFKILLK